MKYFYMKQVHYYEYLVNTVDTDGPVLYHQGIYIYIYIYVALGGDELMYLQMTWHLMALSHQQA